MGFLKRGNEQDEDEDSYKETIDTLNKGISRQIDVVGAKIKQYEDDMCLFLREVQIKKQDYNRTKAELKELLSKTQKKYSTLTKELAVVNKLPNITIEYKKKLENCEKNMQKLKEIFDSAHQSFVKN